MMLLRQFQNKVRSHGLPRTLGYCAVYGWNILATPLLCRLRRTYSQAGEDLLLDRLLNRKDPGFYVDVGAHHPNNLSNTRRFYERGWRGINIEPNPDWHRLFETCRTRDINLNLGVASTEGVLTFHELDAKGLSSFSLDAVQHAKSLGAKTARTLDVPVRPLRTIFAEHADDTLIDFLSVDTEGFDYEVLDSNDWERWRPRLICIEAVSEEDVLNEPVLQQHDAFFAKLGYERCAATRFYGRVLNAIYQDTTSTPLRNG